METGARAALARTSYQHVDADLQMRDLTLGQCDNLLIGISHTLIEAGDVFQIARQAIHRYGQDKPKATACSIGDQGLDAGANE